MSWFHSIPIFKLEIYNKYLAEYIKHTPFDLHYSHSCGFEALFEDLPRYQWHQEKFFYDVLHLKPPKDLIKFYDDSIIGARKIIEFLLENKYLNKEWLAYLDWYASNKGKIRRASSIFRNWISPFLYRGIPPESYRALLRYGNTTSKTEEENSVMIKLGLTPSDYMYADVRFTKAWEYTAQRNNQSNYSILVIYKKKYFNNLRDLLPSENYPQYLWARKDKSIDFRDTIVAIIRIRYF